MFLGKNTKFAATVSLIIMAAGFAASFSFAHVPFGFIIMSGFEAGLVGGLADWFAVTALFRHPLGLPIPHTALLPRNRKKITNALVHAIQTQLLNKESILSKLKQFRIAPRLAEVAEMELSRDGAGERVAGLLSKALGAAPQGALSEALLPALREAIRSFDARSALDALGREAAARGFEERLLDAALDYGEPLAASEKMRRRLGEAALSSLANLRQGGWMGFALQTFAHWMDADRLGGMLQEWLLLQVHDLRKSGNPAREAALSALRSMLLGLGTNEQLVYEANRWKERLASPGGALDAAVLKALERIEARLSDAAFCEKTIVPFLKESLAQWKNNADAMEKLDDWIRKQAAAWIENHHGTIGELVKENANRLSDSELVAMMERNLGNDLQWIRVNGAVCGFLIGLGLGILQWLIRGV